MNRSNDIPFDSVFDADYDFEYFLIVKGHVEVTPSNRLVTIWPWLETDFRGRNIFQIIISIKNGFER